jgi:hypothetical protein
MAQNLDIRHILLGEETCLVCLGLLFLRVVKRLALFLFSIDGLCACGDSAVSVGCRTTKCDCRNPRVWFSAY